MGLFSGKSIAQNELAEYIITETNLTKHLEQEVPINKLIKKMNHTEETIKKALKINYIPKLVCDIVCITKQDNQIIVIEYDGMHHYTETGAIYSQSTADTARTQSLDELKDNILFLIGVPVIRIKSTDYYDERTLLTLIKTSEQETLTKRETCSICGRLYPEWALTNKSCAYCNNNISEQIKEQYKQNRKEYYDKVKRERAKRQKNYKTTQLSTKEKERKKQYQEKQRQERKKRYQEYKKSDTYKAKQELRRLYAKKQNKHS